MRNSKERGGQIVIEEDEQLDELQSSVERGLCLGMIFFREWCLTKARKYILRKLYKEEKLLRMMNTLDGNYFTIHRLLCKYALRTFLLLLFLIISSIIAIVIVDFVYPRTRRRTLFIFSTYPR